MKFTKMHGTGNDFIFLLDLNNEYVGQEESLAKKLCHRRFGIGADGLVLVRNSNVADIQMVIINSDGSRANMCGNAIRCFGKYVYESIEEKAANFLYMIVKNHVFIDGNKRIAATLFIYFLNYYQILYKDHNQVIDNNTLVALTLLNC